MYCSLLFVYLMFSQILFLNQILTREKRGIGIYRFLNSFLERPHKMSQNLSASLKKIFPDFISFVLDVTS